MKNSETLLNQNVQNPGRNPGDYEVRIDLHEDILI